GRLERTHAHAVRGARRQRHPRELDEPGVGPNGHGRRGGATLGGRRRGYRRLVEPPAFERPDGPILSRPEAHTVVTRKWRAFILLLAALALAACGSVSRLAYLNAPPLATWYIGSYVDLTDAQKKFVKDRL